jgi:hypothetical protein
MEIAMDDLHMGCLRKPPLEDWEEIIARFDEDKLGDRDMIEQGLRKSADASADFDDPFPDERRELPAHPPVIVLGFR